ncbi:MAG: type III secretion system export apparatus subunit SctV [Deltaproteobacteria bacterium]|nr:type III secretion system export apparatus subunit SctV [Deltaproteobacteria bacterium]
MAQPVAAAEAQAPATPARRPRRGLADIALAVLVVAIVATMIVPLPTALLDVLLAANLSLSVVLLLVALYVPDALAIASFPTVLLVTTLYRLALDVAATRLILGRGDGGEVIQAFGQFVVRGNYVVGGVMFLILTLVQFLVIARGSERVAEVAARFALDAMPGKQMAIDAELRGGGIDQTEARRRRRFLARESQFYGAMDGAMKFVKGDAIASMVIAVVNILGGLAIGVLQRDMSPADALARYGLLTIGEGLVAQIPALVISTAAGVIVTRVASEEPDVPLGTEIGAQLVAQPRALAIAAGLLALFALAPGMPAMPFLVIAAALGAGARAVVLSAERRARKAEVIGPRPASTPAEVRRTREADGERDDFQPGTVPVALELGAAHAALVESTDQGDAPLRVLIPGMREALFRELGVVFPGVRVRRSAASGPRHVVLKIHEVPAVSFAMPEGSVLCFAPPEVVGEAHAPTATPHPVTGERCAWVPMVHRAALEAQGLPCLDPAEVVVVHLAHCLRSNAARFVGIQETQAMLDGLERQYPALVRQVVPKPVPVALLADVLRRLVDESVSVRNLREVLEAMAQVAPTEKDPVVLVEHVRGALRRELTHRHAPDGRLAAWLLAPEIEDAMRDGIQRTATGSWLALDPSLTADILAGVRASVGAGGAGVVLTTVDLRRFVRKLLETEFPRLEVLSFQDLDPKVQVAPRGRIHP